MFRTSGIAALLALALAVPAQEASAQDPLLGGLLGERPAPSSRAAAETRGAIGPSSRNTGAIIAAEGQRGPTILRNGATCAPTGRGSRSAGYCLRPHAPPPPPPPRLLSARSTIARSATAPTIPRAAPISGSTACGTPAVTGGDASASGLTPTCSQCWTSQPKLFEAVGELPKQMGTICLGRATSLAAPH